MMSVICSICLERVRSPVCSPCGHIHCEDCLSEAIGAPDGSSQANCPTCRAPFYVNPSEKVSRQYRRYIYPSTRRIYLDEHPDEDLHAKLADLESRLVKLINEKSTLHKRLQSAQIADLEAREARHQLTVAERKCKIAEAQLDERAASLRSAKEEMAGERDAHEKCKAECERLRQLLADAGRKRKRSDDETDVGSPAPKRGQPLRRRNTEYLSIPMTRSRSRSARRTTRALKREGSSSYLSVGSQRSLSVKVD
ncbi:hypothetical protein OE88DRAFT_1724282 [Heliocybe sulcata]|uniref:RING-type domain-containing protein n=1 Tax=Heliocybe sulcata TaxID=5364 RepID=A0A5C3N8L3_9AGAM|nr:hypothetical protein OE88DRAFT_1724282 [Heliocybe sulcata]